MLSYPSDEVGNHLFDMDLLDDSGVNPYTDVLTLEDYRRIFGYIKHPFTGVDYVEYYADLIKEEGAEAEIVFANHPEAIVKFTKNVLCCDIHTRAAFQTSYPGSRRRKSPDTGRNPERSRKRQRLQPSVWSAGLQQSNRRYSKTVPQKRTGSC